MDIDSCFELGHVVRLHGLKGEIGIYLDVDDPSRYRKLESVFIEINNRLVPFTIREMKVRGNHALIRLEDIDSPEQAGKLVSRRLFLPMEYLPDLGNQHFYYHEIIGFTLIDGVLGPLGKVARLYDSGGAWLIGMDVGGKEVLVPLNRQLIRKIDKKNREIHMELPEGLIDIYLNP